MKVFRCRDVSPAYCPFELRADNVDAIVEQIVAHGKAEHGLTDEMVHPAMVGMWKSRMRDETDSR